jgi:hypothetical protein
MGIGVKTCSGCGRDFWATIGDNGICNACNFKMRQEAEAKRLDQEKQARKIEARENRIQERGEKRNKKAATRAAPINSISSVILRVKKKLLHERDTAERQRQKYQGYVYLMRAENGM